MKNSKAFFLTGATLFFLWIIGGFDPYLSWEQRLFKIALVSIFAFTAWVLKSSKKRNQRKTGLIIVLLLAAGIAYAEPYASHLLFGHHHFFCGK